MKEIVTGIKAYGKRTFRYLYGSMITVSVLCGLTACGTGKTVIEEPENEEIQSGVQSETQPEIQSESQPVSLDSPQDEKDTGSGENTQTGFAFLEGQIPEQSFQTALDGWGDVTFASFIPLEYPSENPDYGATMFGDVRFMLLSGDEVIYTLPGMTQDNILSGFMQWQQILAVRFLDYNEDGRTDIFILQEYIDSDGNSFYSTRAYTQAEGEIEFRIDTSDDALMALLNEKQPYYQKSAYYSEISDYWEKTRGVLDVSNRIEPLYGTDRIYFTEENFSYDPPVVIHLAKNEIYARHGYIFQNQDLYNYFMGCIWYQPTTMPQDFSDGVFNAYEKANLELLSELDTM